MNTRDEDTLRRTLPRQAYLSMAKKQKKSPPGLHADTGTIE